jgi:reverse gyrase
MVGEVPGPGYEESKGETMGHLMIAASGGGVFALVILYVALYFIFTLGVYGTYKKAGPNGDPAWSAFVPIYNFIRQLSIIVGQYLTPADNSRTGPTSTRNQW